MSTISIPLKHPSRRRGTDNTTSNHLRAPSVLNLSIGYTHSPDFNSYNLARGLQLLPIPNKQVQMQELSPLHQFYKQEVKKQVQDKTHHFSSGPRRGQQGVLLRSNYTFMHSVASRDEMSIHTSLDLMGWFLVEFSPHGTDRSKWTIRIIEEIWAGS